MDALFLEPAFRSWQKLVFGHADPGITFGVTNAEKTRKKRCSKNLLDKHSRK